MTTDSGMNLRKHVINYVKDTPIGNGFRASRDELNAILDKHFADGKRAADFVGMISQSTLCMFFVSYLFKQSNAQSGVTFERFVYGWSALMFLALYLYICYKIMRITVYYFMRDAANRASFLGKVYPVFISISSGLCIYYGQFSVVRAIVTSNTLLK
jgi:hypothetical protein